MVKEGETCPPWIMMMLKTTFYNTCEHHQKRKTYFCTKCTSLAFCEVCKNNNLHHEHQEHTILKVIKASHKVAIRCEDIKDLLDISCIYHYKNNGKFVVYLYERALEGHKKRNASLKSGSNIEGCCQECRWEFKDYLRQFKFCSIQCKVLSENHQHQHTSSSSSSKTAREELLLPKQNLKHSRKQTHPKRSPFF